MTYEPFPMAPFTPDDEDKYLLSGQGEVCALARDDEWAVELERRDRLAEKLTPAATLMQESAEWSKAA